MNSTRREVLSVLGGWLGVCGCAAAQDEPELLPADQAFQIRSASFEAGWLEVVFWVAPGYAIYQERVRISPESTAVSVGAFLFPKGQQRYDAAMGETLTYLRGLVRVRAAVKGARGAFTVTATVQGCADAGLCYPPVARTFVVG